jgi:hypothetical protein
MTASRRFLFAIFVPACASGLAAAGAGGLDLARSPSPALVEAPPLVGRATESSIEVSVLPASRSLRVALLLDREEDGGGEAAVRFERPRPAARPFPCVRVEGTLAADPRSGDAGASRDLFGDAPLLPAATAAELVVRGLAEGSAWRWRLVVAEGEPGARLGAAVATQEFTGRFVSVRPRGSSFTFAVFSDSHIFPATLEPQLPREVVEDERILNYALDSIIWYRTMRERVAYECERSLRAIDAERPDFAVSLGDAFDLHGRGFNWAFESPELAAGAHREVRRTLSALSGAGALYEVIGNWEGESGCHPPELRRFAIDARKRYAINPLPDTGRLGGGGDEDYFAWRWGDLLCVALNVRGYTPTPHNLGNEGAAEGKADDYTLGAEQKAFLEKTLKGSDLPYKVTFIHHTVGGNAGDAENSAYGRGGGRAARVGEQAWVHDLCRATGVQVFFYGHDHVFTDMEVDGVHYSLPGTTSAPWRFSQAETGYAQSFPDSGYARVKVSPEKMRVEFVTLDGKVLPISYDVAPRR